MTGADRAAVVVTGLGAVSSLGDGVDRLWNGLLQASAEPTPVPDGGRSSPPLVYRVTEDLPPVGPGGRSRFGRASALAARAVEQALAAAGLTAADRRDAGLTVGTTLGDIDLVEPAGRQAGLPASAGGASFQVTEAVAARHGLGGPVLTMSTACSAGVYAVSWAAELIRSGDAEVVVACGTDGYSRVARASLDRFGLLDDTRCRPFDADRQGMVTGEGAAALVLESASHARRRGARSHATVLGDGWSCDAFHPTAPEPDGAQLRRAVAGALAAAGALPGAVVLHRAGIPVNDVVESQVVADQLGEAVGGVPAYGIKAVIGHTAGAAGAFGCVAAALILRHGVVPPNAHVRTLDPACPLAVPVGEAVPLPAPRVLVCATGFGGNNAAVVLGAP